MDFKKTAAGIADHFGLESQMDVAQEELAELIQAISKLRRAGQAGLDTPEKRVRYIEARCNVSEEMADVANLLIQLTHLLRNEPTVEFWLEHKLGRTLFRMERGEI